MIFTPETQDYHLSQKHNCPLYEGQIGRCQQSPVNMSARRHLCTSDDHDRCPAYLGYLLRRTRTLRRDNDWLDVC